MKTRGQLSFMYMEDKLVANRGFCPRIKAGAGAGTAIPLRLNNVFVSVFSIKR